MCEIFHSFSEHVFYLVIRLHIKNWIFIHISKFWKQKKFLRCLFHHQNCRTCFFFHSKMVLTNLYRLWKPSALGFKFFLYAVLIWYLFKYYKETVTWSDNRRCNADRHKQMHVSPIKRTQTENTSSIVSIVAATSCR